MTDLTASRGEGAVLLLVDDEEYVRTSTAELLERRGYVVRTAASGREAFSPALLDGVDAVITDLRMPEMDGSELVAAVAERDPGLPILVLTAHGTVGSAVDCLRLGAVDYLLKPVDPKTLVHAISRALGEASSRRELTYLRELTRSSSVHPLGRSPAWRNTMDLAARVGDSATSVVLIGESGTGKEEVARFLHRIGPRRDQPLVIVNCAAIPDELFESELFGHRRGAFTGAIADREGRFHVAHKGTLMLDEINSLSLVNQAKLLRVLQDGAFERLGDSRPTTVDVRLVCASNRDLEQEVAASRFRSDLYFRINVVTLKLPPLRERREDISLLAHSFLEQFARQLDRPVGAITGRALSALESYSWPGNVRELRNVIERGVLLTTGEWLDVDVLPFLETVPAPPTSNDRPTLDLRERLRAVEQRTLLQALEQAAGVRREAARLLGIDERNLSYYLRKHDLMSWRPNGGDAP